MIALTTTSMVLRMQTFSTQTVEYSTSYIDYASDGTGTGVAGSSVGQVSSITTTSIVPAPAASTVRVIQQVFIHIQTAGAGQIKVGIFDGTTFFTAVDKNYSISQRLEYSPDRGWRFKDEPRQFFATEVEREDFCGGMAEQVTYNKLYSKWVWRDNAPSESAPYMGMAYSGSNSGHPGIMYLSSSGFGTNPGVLLAAADGYIDSWDSLAGTHYRLDDISYIKIVCQIGGVGGTTRELDNVRYGVGLMSQRDSAGLTGTTPGTAVSATGIALFFRSSASTWRAYVIDAGTQTDVDTGITAVVDNWVEVVFERTSVNTFRTWFNGDVVIQSTTLDVSGISNSVCPVIWMHDFDPTSAADRKTLYVDLFEIGLNISERWD
jgi:hypothetical protein